MKIKKVKLIPSYQDILVDFKIVIFLCGSFTTKAA